MVNVRITGSDDLRALSADFDEAGRVAPEKVHAVVQKGCLNIKNDWRRTWDSLGNLPALPRSITYDTDVTGTKVVGEVGPEHGRRQAELAHLIEFEYGSTKNAPKPGGAPALERERPRFEKALEDLAADGLERGR